MKRAARGLIIFACAGTFSALTQSPATSQQTAGLESDWDIAAVLQKIGAHAERVLPLLEQADVSAWQSHGAPAAYAAQLQSSKEQARALADEAKTVAANPEVLSGELRVLFREQGLETTIGSVAEAMRKYQSGQAAQELIAASAEAGEDRDRLQRYVVNLAAERENEYQVMDKEAQRCRGIMLAPTTAKKKK